MTTKQIIDLISREMGISKVFLANQIGGSRQSFNYKINADTLSEDDKLKIINSVGLAKSATRIGETEVNLKQWLRASK